MVSRGGRARPLQRRSASLHKAPAARRRRTRGGTAYSDALCPYGQRAFFDKVVWQVSEKQKGTLCVFLAALLYSIGGLCMKVIPWGGTAINGGRTAIALVVIGVYLIAVRHPLRFNRWILLGALSVFSTNLLFSIANKMTTAANAIVLQFTAPVFVMLFSMLFFKRRPAKLDLAACVLVFGGIVFFFADSLSAGGGAGNFLALLSGVTYAGIFMLNELPDSDAISCVFWGDVLSAIVGIPFVAKETDFTLIPMVSLLVLGVFQVAVGYILLTIGLRTTPPVTASLVSGIEPILNPILVAVFYGEKMGRFALVGAAIVIVGVVGYNILKGKNDKKHQQIKEQSK